jgi:hypothetical protein
MTDRELLEAAAKAAGYEVTWDEKLGDFTEKKWFSYTWNPLTSDEDAFRLMVDCTVVVCVMSESVNAAAADVELKEIKETCVELFKDHNNDKHAATRRAIVRAAAGE